MALFRGDFSPFFSTALVNSLREPGSKWRKGGWSRKKINNQTKDSQGKGICAVRQRADGWRVSLGEGRQFGEWRKLTGRPREAGVRGVQLLGSHICKESQLPLRAGYWWCVDPRHGMWAQGPELRTGEKGCEPQWVEAPQTDKSGWKHKVGSLKSRTGH